MAAEPFWFTYLCTSIDRARVRDQAYRCLTTCDKTEALLTELLAKYFTFDIFQLLQVWTICCCFLWVRRLSWEILDYLPDRYLSCHHGEINVHHQGYQGILTDNTDNNGLSESLQSATVCFNTMYLNSVTVCFNTIHCCVPELTLFTTVCFLTIHWCVPELMPSNSVCFLTIHCCVPELMPSTTVCFLSIHCCVPELMQFTTVCFLTIHCCVPELTLFTTVCFLTIHWCVPELMPSNSVCFLTIHCCVPELMPSTTVCFLSIHCCVPELMQFTTVCFPYYSLLCTWTHAIHYCQLPHYLLSTHNLLQSVSPLFTAVYLKSCNPLQTASPLFTVRIILEACWY